MILIAGVLLRLKDGHVVLNRRGKTAPVSAGLLALYGGHIEKGESPKDAARRELSEETSLKFNHDDLKFLTEFELAEAGIKKFYAFELMAANQDFDVDEGDGSETYSVEEALARKDLTASLRRTLETVRGKSGIKHN